MISSTHSKQSNAVKFNTCLLIVGGLLTSLVTHASELSDRLQSGDYVLLMRHTLAPGIGDPANYTLSDCKSQRNLSTEGRAQAKTVGNWLRKQGIQKADVHSSPWCRCKDTAELLNFGEVKVGPSLASFFDEMHKAKERNQALQSFIAERLKVKGDQALILVTHHVNIFEFMGENIASGDMVLAKVDATGKIVSYQRIARPG
jgi:phosphohistidine phosphatase SixA